MQSQPRSFLHYLFPLVLLLGVLQDVYAFSVAENLNNGIDFFPTDPGQNLRDSDSPTLVLELGQNVAIGSLGVCFTVACREDFDSFRIQVPEGLQISQTRLLVENLDGTAEQLWLFPGPPGGAGILRHPSLDGPFNPNPAWKTGALFALTDNITTINGPGPVVNNTILGPGYYDVVAHNFAFIGGGAWEATFTAEVQTIPVPASFWFAATGLIALRRLSRERLAQQPGSVYCIRSNSSGTPPGLLIPL